MTRERAIEILNNNIRFMEMFLDDSASEQVEAYKVAVEVLEAKDRISRAELFNRLAYIKAPAEANDYKAEVYALIQSMEV